ncbi:MAG TPA: elongation factor 1-beta [Methanocellales archaeon]|nr:elongation factor 1-beta [Methanocellales archaeon]
MLYVAATIKIMPKDPNIDFEKLKADIRAAVPEGARLQGFAEEPIAFGLKALIAAIIVKDEEGGTERAEESFAKVHGVESIQVIEFSRI